MKLPDKATGIIALTSLAVFGCGGADDVECYHPADGVAVVENGTEGVWDQRGVHPTFNLLWRRGGTNQGEELAYPAGATVSRAGRVAIPDFQLAELIIIDVDGAWKSPWATGGPGPGELSAPAAAAWASPDTVVVFDIGASELEYITVDGGYAEAVPGAFAGPVVASGQIHWVAVDERGATYLKVTGRADGGDSQVQTIVRQPRGEEVDTLLSVRVPVVSEGRFRDVPLPGFPTATAAVGGGHAFLADPDGRYLITVTDSEGRPVKHICRAALPPPLTESEVGADSVPDRLHELAAAFQEASRPDQVAAIGRLVAGAAGGLWVQRERPEPWDGDGAFYGVAGAIHDVFDPNGAFLGTLELPEGFRLQTILGDTVWGFRRGELGEVWVEAYEVRIE